MMRCAFDLTQQHEHCATEYDMDETAPDIGGYDEWIASKYNVRRFDSAPVVGVTPDAFPHQRDLINWALRKGRAAIFADTGLGKTIMQLEWARSVSSVGRVLIIAPLAVCAQTVAEGDRFSIDCVYRREDQGDLITVTNYEMVEHFDPSAFVGVVLDESSILKSFTGKTRNLLIHYFGITPYRLACTATPAPNDFTELGNHSEFLGVKSRVEMLAEYFCHDGGSTQDWRVKGHAVKDFWRWVATWGAVVKSPSDLGHDGGAYRLPPINMTEHIIRIDHKDAWSEGLLFAPQAENLTDQRTTRKATLGKRVEFAAKIANAANGPVLIWCEFNREADALARAIQGSVNVQGSDSPEVKADRLNGFSRGDFRVLITKPKIAGFGMNWQHCADMVFMGASHSYEQTYQAIRRCWRFGQKKRVSVNIIRAETEAAVIANYRRKEASAARMAKVMTAMAGEVLRADVGVASGREWNPYTPSKIMTVPSWVGAEED
jgi:superfamily II DNA or RNA helicase